MEHGKGCAVLIEDFGMSSRLNSLPVTEDMPFDVQEACPACETKLETCALLIDGTRKRRLRYGLCASCGYMGYIDRPSERWIIDFYSEDWDQEFVRSPEEMRRAADDLQAGRGGQRSRFLAVSLLEKITADKEAFVCDIGSGYGQVLEYFRQAGFKRLVGVENSGHRSRLVKEVFGIDVLHGGFQEESVQARLRALGRVGLFFSHHVFEHTYHPADVIRMAAALQKEGDHLIFALPDAEGEHVDYALLYLVHLHSFTKESLEVLFNRFGYEIVADASPDPTNLIVAAKKVAGPQARHGKGGDHRKGFVERFRKGFLLDAGAGGKPYAIYWDQRDGEADTAKVEKRLSVPALTRAWWYVRKAIDFAKSRGLKRFTGGHRMLLRALDVSAPSESGACEIRFKDRIQFLIK